MINTKKFLINGLLVVIVIYLSVFCGLRSFFHYSKGFPFPWYTEVTEGILYPGQSSLPRSTNYLFIPLNIGVLSFLFFGSKFLYFQIFRKRRLTELNIVITSLYISLLLTLFYCFTGLRLFSLFAEPFFELRLLLIGYKYFPPQKYMTEILFIFLSNLPFLFIILSLIGKYKLKKGYKFLL